LFNSLAADDPGVQFELQQRHLPDPQLAAQNPPEMRRGVVERVGYFLGVRRRERRVVHGGVGEIACHIYTCERHQLEPRVAHLLEFICQHLEYGFVEPSGPRVAAGRGHSASSHAVSVSSSSMSGAIATKRSTEASASRT